MATFIGLIVKMEISVFSHTTVYSTFNGFHIIGLKVTKLG